MFQNPELSLDDLPRVDDVDWQPMHRSLLTQILLQQGFVFAIISIASMAIRFIPNVTFIPLWAHVPLLLVLLTIMVVWPILSVRVRGIAFRDKDILYRSGVISHKVTAIPFNRIQHVETKQGPLDRRFGTSSLQIFTAGGSKGDLDIEGLERDLAERLRGTILKRIGSSIEQD